MKIALLISGGVDSSVALKLVLEQGHEVEAFYLKIWLEDELSSLAACPWKEDLSYVEKTCTQLGVKLHVLSLQKEYYERVVAATLAQTQAGQTPNPDVLCNQYIKFGIFYDCIDSSFEKVATGHYAQLEEKDGLFLLKRSPDHVKDQTYFLCNLNQAQLSRALFPIGHLNKKEVRTLAQTWNLPSYQRKDSQGICFLGKFKFNDFLAHHLGTRVGNLIEFESGKTIGTHQGHWYYTIGQRQGIRLSGGPWYVVSKDAQRNTVFISNTYESIEGPREHFTVTNLEWFSKTPLTEALRVKIRHRAEPIACTIVSDSSDKIRVHLAQKDQGIAPGQFAVFYDRENYCRGRGVISF